MLFLKPGTLHPTVMSFLPELMRVRTQGGFNRVRIFHPGCRQLLFSLPAIFQTYPSGSCAGSNPESSTLPRDDDAPGVNHRLVLDACHSITNHVAEERDCYLSRDHQGQVPVMSSGHLGGSLPPGKYYYQPGPPSSRKVANYPIVTDFAAWRYPTKGPPDHWRRPHSVERAMAKGRHCHDCCNEPGEFRVEVSMDDRDVGCVVTKNHWGESEVSALFLVPALGVQPEPDSDADRLTTEFTETDVVRLVPIDRKDWFEHHDMGRYNIAGPGPDIYSSEGPEVEFDYQSPNDPANGFLLRLDVADLFRRHAFVFYPAGLGDGKFQFMAYMCGGFFDYVPLLHRRLVTLPLRVSDEFLYARFGLSIIHRVHHCLDFDPFPIPEGVKPSKLGGE